MAVARSVVVFVSLLATTLCCSEAVALENMVRNGSFEGGLLYWHNQKGKEIVEGGKVGRFALQISKGWTLSAPIPMERNLEYTISLWARSAGGESRVSVGMPPMAREVAVKAKRIWTKGAARDFVLSTDWQRISVTFAADVKRHGFWPLPLYGVFLGASDICPHGLHHSRDGCRGQETAPLPPSGHLRETRTFLPSPRT